MKITIKSLISDLEELVRNNSDVALLARNVLDKYRNELPGVEQSVVQLIDEKFQAVAKSIIQNQDTCHGSNEKCRFREHSHAALSFDLIAIDLTTGKDDAGNDTYIITVAADNSASVVKAHAECKFHLCVLKLNEPARSQTGANCLFPYVVSCSITVGDDPSQSLSLINI